MTAIRPRRRTSPHRPAGPSRFRRHTGIAIDLGSSRTRAWTEGRGIILDVRTVSFPGTGAEAEAGTAAKDGAEAVAGARTGRGTSYPVQRGAIVDPEGTARMLDRLLSRRLPLLGRTVIALTTPVLGGVAYREAARKALQVLRPAEILTIPTAKAIALGAGADPARPLLIVDVGAHLTEVFLLADGEIVDAHRTDLGTDDLDGPAYSLLTEAVAGTVTGMLRSDSTRQAQEALRHGVLLAGGGALRPELAHGLSGQLHASVQPAPAPHTVAVRGAARHLKSVHTGPPGGESAGPVTRQQ